jgi:hypothetical protein
LTSPLDDEENAIADEDKIQVVYLVDAATSAVVSRLQ